jgi:hypothetical protein
MNHTYIPARITVILLILLSLYTLALDLKVFGLLACFSLMSINLNGKSELTRKAKYLGYLGLMLIYASGFLITKNNGYNGMFIGLLLLWIYYPLVTLIILIDGFRKVKWQAGFENKLMLLLLIVLFSPGMLA